MDVRALTIALGCEVSDSPGTSFRPTTSSASASLSARSESTAAVSPDTGEPSQREVLASESWEEFEERCRSPASESITTTGLLEEALAGFRDNTTLARATVVWKTENGSSRRRLLIIRSCARLGRAEVVLELLHHNLKREALCEDLFLDAVHGDKPTVVQGLLGSRFFEPARGFLGYALAECGASRSPGCAACMIEDERCRTQALQQCDLERFGLPPWSYVRALENAIVRAVEAGAGDRNDAASPPGGNHECLRLLATFAKRHLQDGEWQRILRLAIVMGAEGSICAILRVFPSLLLQAEKLPFCAGSQAAAMQRNLGYVHLLGLSAQDVSCIEVPPS